MTRENKLALVVGFGLILFVGILISDHFSTVRHQQVANLHKPPMEPVINPASVARVYDLLPPTPAVTTTSMASASDPVRPEQRTMINPNGYVQSRIVQQPGADVHAAANNLPVVDGFLPVKQEPAAVQVKVKHHDVQAGQTLYAICREQYGDISLVKALAEYNKLDDPASLRVGRRLMIPPAEEIGGRTIASSTSPPSTQTAPAQPKPSAPTTYVVKSGDSLAGIAQRFLGSKGKWKKLHDMNRDVIDNPDDLRVGMVLKVANG